MSDQDIMLQEAIEAIRQGQRARARDLLTRLLRLNQSNPEYWLWMSSVVETLKEQVYCLQSVLRLDPQNASAKQGLILLGAMPPDKTIKPPPPIRRKWEAPQLPVPRRNMLKAMWSSPIVRILVFSLLAFGTIGGVIFGISKILSSTASKPAVVAFIPTRTPGPSPTFTNTPTPLGFVPKAPTSTPSFAGPPPLWTFLEATYTPTPEYVSTPHPINEAFTIAMRALQRGDYERAAEGLRQAQTMDPKAPDIAFHLGEVYRLMGNYSEALAAYEQAIAINPDFAPAYLARAVINRLTNPQAKILDDLNLAIQKDPNLGLAYLERAAYYMRQGDGESALKDLSTAETLLPGSPLLYLYRAQIYLAQGKLEAALEDARRANQLDLTMLPGYLVLGQAAIQNQEYEEALKALETYTIYEKKDPSAWLALGQALYATQAYSDTLQALDTAIGLDKGLADAYLYRGLAYLELGQGRKAVNDIYFALQKQPKDFDANLAFGRALLSDNRLGDALNQFIRCEGLAETDQQLAQVYYWRALTKEANGNLPAALLDWKALLALPKDGVPKDWIAEALSRFPPTPTLTPTRTPAPTRSLTPTRTPVPSPTTSPTRTPVPTRTPTPSRTPPPATPTSSPTPV